MKKLEQAEEELTRLNQSKDKFYAILTHDLKNPFNAILLTTTQLIKKFPTLNNQEIEEYAQYIHDSAQSLYQLLENLLNWAQTQRGNLKFNPVMTDIYEVIYAILPGSVADAKNKNIQIISEIHENTIAFFDIEMISATIRNLINNAIKFSYTGSIIKIKAEKDKSNLIVSIIDSGIGISADKIPSIFSGDSYFTTTGTADETGSGLGLMICTEFIEKHGGKIWVESVPTKGSTFRFIIPLYDEFKH
jgi:signal transduction histidine kinase